MPTYKQNPKPAQVFELTVTIENAPGPFASINGVMQYDITNMDCLPPAEFFSGVQTTPISTFLPIALTKVADNTYRGRVALDGLLDGDYFGHGECHFKPIGSSISFKATGADGETRFFAQMSAEEIAVNGVLAKYYWKGGYPRDRKVNNYPDHGSDSAQEFLESLRQELFSVTTKARTAQQL